jgi:putative transposase
LALAEMYVKGVSTRRVKEITETLCGLEVSASQVSRAAAELDEELRQWRERPLSICEYLVLDARYEKVRHGGQVIDEAVLTAIGIDPAGKRSILGVSVSLSEAEEHWRCFLDSLRERGLRGLKLVISDDHAGLRAARQRVFPGVPWQRCQVHLHRNAIHYVPKRKLRREVSHDLAGVFAAPDRDTAERMLREMVAKWEKRAPRLARWLEENVPEGFAVYTAPPIRRYRLKSTNLMERINLELRRRTRVVTIFPNENSLLRLVSAILVEISEQWEVQKTRYLPRLSLPEND